MNPHHRVTWYLNLALLPLFAAAAGPDQPDKSQYHLFNPTPASQLRPMIADSPLTTESAYTVDAGHVQVEMDLFNYLYDHGTSGGGDIRFEAFSTTGFNLRLGVLNDLELEVLATPYLHVRTHDVPTGAVQESEGFGDVTIRSKLNLWGNDQGKTAFALLPFVKIPTASSGLGNEAVEGGIALPFAAELPGGWYLGLTAEVDILEDKDGSGHHADFAGSITVSRYFTEVLAGYLEFINIAGTEEGTWTGLVAPGITYNFTPNLQLDGGVVVGVNSRAPDVNPYLALIFRF